MDSRQPLLLAYVLSAVAAVAAILGSLVIMETATIKVTVPTTKIVADKTITGGASGQEVTTTRIQADVSDSQQGTTSVAAVSPAYATGQVVFTCSPCPSNALSIPDGTTVSTAAGIHYATQGRADIVPPSTSVQAAIRSLQPGTPGNTGSNTVTVIDKPIANVKVTNPSPIVGGANATTAQVVQQSDLDRVRAALTARVTQDLNAALTAQAGGLVYAADGSPTLNVTSDHKVGDQVATFTMTITGTLGAIAFSQSQADALIRTALVGKIPQGFQLTSNPIQTTYGVQHTGANGDVTIKGSAIGLMVANVTEAELKARIRGMRVDAARKQLEHVTPGTTVEMSVRPAVPWLPVLQDHIKLTIVLEPAAA
ncbi:MAG: hypothetical protein AUI42_02730 [Actinobacteria bacterium 13_1_40CM_2_65_8]|nr:MAG: hypothetical protein AUI42_02730 [Actinobacteria bacterium 13_1_40CM_2_65_8]